MKEHHFKNDKYQFETHQIEAFNLREKFKGECMVYITNTLLPGKGEESSYNNNTPCI